mmetsp:Transcript_28750/g.96891  ORF Transcript_28750/g.96891 Transcript_28750/m.96891 type:complete len:85 (+) Transcript_28750:187-441(+)
MAEGEGDHRAKFKRASLLNVQGSYRDLSTEKSRARTGQKVSWVDDDTDHSKSLVQTTYADNLHYSVGAKKVIEVRSGRSCCTVS